MSDSQTQSTTSWQRFKDAMELLSKLATVALTAIAFYATYTYNRQQDLAREHREREQASLQQLQTIIGLFDPLSSQEPKRHRLAVLTVQELTANVPLALKLCLAAASQAECATTASTFAIDTLLRLSADSSSEAGDLRHTALAALDVRQSAPDTGAGRPRPVPTVSPDVPGGGPAPGQPETALKTGWVFLGTYSNGTWVTRYLDFPTTARPEALAGTTLAIRPQTGALNIRGNLFYEPGYDHILDVLTKGSRVHLLEVSSFAHAGYYIWAKVRYQAEVRQPT